MPPNTNIKRDRQHLFSTTFVLKDKVWRIDFEKIHRLCPKLRRKKYNLPVFQTEQALPPILLLIVLKPLWGSHGKGVTKIKSEGGQYVAHLQNEKFSLETVEELAKFYAEHCTKYIQILQPYIASRTQQGNPFDIRLHARRGAEGKFNLFPYPRIGRLDTIVSNINAGGYTMPIKAFLQTEFGDDWNILYDKLIQLGNTLPEYCQSLLKNNLYNVGIDVGIQRLDSGYDLKIFEINMRYLGSRCLPIDAAITSLEYYRYIYDKLRKDKSE